MRVQFDDVRTTQISNDIFLYKEFDLLIANFPEGLPVPLVSPSAIPKWSKHDGDKMEAIFEFAFHFLHNDAHILVFVPKSKNIRVDVRTLILQQLTNLFSLEIGGASTSCIYVRAWMHLQRYV